jgi:hypothetical protein
MNHPAELKVHQYLSDVRHGDSTLSSEIVEQIVEDIRAALTRQFVDKLDKGFTLRMSNVGRAYCQLWFDKNEPHKAIPHSTTFIMNMMIGDIIEAVFKGLLKQSGVAYEDGTKVTLDLNEYKIHGTPDIIMDGKVDDVKSASPWSYENKFKTYETLAASDSFGYLAQLAGYAKAMGIEAGGWWVVNKANGQFKYVPADGLNVDVYAENIKAIAAELEENVFRRCYEAETETYYNKPTGNKILGKECQWCSYRYACWDTLEEIPSLVSKAENPPTVSYVFIKKKGNESKDNT